MRLFEAHGFDATTIVQIAQAADVSPRTVFVHYPTKEDLVFGDVEGALDALTAQLASRAPGETVLQTIRDWLRDVATGWLQPDLALQVRLADQVPTIAERKTAIAQRFHAPLAAAIATDLHAAADDLRAHLAAAAIVAGLLRAEALVSAHIRQGRPLPSTRRIATLFNEVDTFIRAGIDAL